MATPIDVNAIVTDRDLADEVTRAKLERTGVRETERDTHRAKALQDFLDAIQRRTPPIREYDIANTDELKRGITYRALEKIFRDARAVAGDTWDVLHADYRREAQAQFTRTITVQGGAKGPSGGGFRWERA